MLIMHHSAFIPSSQPHRTVAAPEPHLPSRRHSRRAVARALHTSAAREDDMTVTTYHERDGTASASTSGMPHLLVPRSSTRFSAGTLQPMTPAMRNVRTHVAAPMASTQHSSGQQQQTSLILSACGSQLSSATPAVMPTAPVAASSQDGHFQDRELYEEIKACDSWQDVLEVIADEAPAISLHTATQAASRLLATVRLSPVGVLKATSMLHVQPAFHTLVGVLSTGVPRMSRAQLCNSLHAMAQLKAPLDDATVAAYALRTQQLAPELNARDISQLLHGWGVLKRSPGTQALDLVGFRAKVLLEEGLFEPQSVSMMLTGLAALDYRNHLLLGAAASVATLRIAEFAPQGVANVCWSLAKLGHLSPATLASAARAYSGDPDAYKVQEVCNLLWAMAAQRYHPEGSLALMVRSLVKRSGSLRPVDYSMLFHALGTFGVHPGNQMLSELLQALPRQLQRFSPAELCSVFWGLGLIGETRQAAFVQIAGLLPDHFERGRLNDGLLRQVFQAFLCCKLEDVLSDDTGAGKKGAARAHGAASFPPVMLEAMKRAWRVSALANTVTQAAAAAHEGEEGHAEEGQGGVQGEGTAGPQLTGAPRQHSKSIKQEVASIVKALRVPHETGRPTKDGLVMIDVAIKAGEERFIALQVVMEHEHTCNTGQFLGPLQFQTQVLEMNGWEVRHVRAMDLKSLDHSSKPLFIADLLRSMGVRVAGGARSGGAGGRSAGAGRNAKPASGLDMLMEEGTRRDGKRRGN